jgi:acetyl-CoA synthetase
VARELGADYVVNAAEQDPPAEIQKLGGADAAIALAVPKARSGKIMRRLLRDIADGRTLGDITTLRDPTVMAELEQKVAAAQAEQEWARLTHRHPGGHIG